MTKKKQGVPGTMKPAPENIPAAEQQQEMVVPVEILFHIAACKVEKIGTDLVELSLISPTGIGVTARMSQENANELAGNLMEEEDAPKVDVFTSMPGLGK